MSHPASEPDFSGLYPSILAQLPRPVQYSEDDTVLKNVMKHLMEARVKAAAQVPVHLATQEHAAVKCVRCRKDAPEQHRCTHCRIRYCSKECMQEDESDHRRVCDVAAIAAHLR